MRLTLSLATLSLFLNVLFAVPEARGEVSLMKRAGDGVNGYIEVMKRAGDGVYSGYSDDDDDVSFSEVVERAGDGVYSGYSDDDDVDI
ncbi:hypothetical protein PILCRDRAFT_816960 [Piloderma croceum F 1598]|uniref:Uncharacterized protein n=1 Tax=Piloderma croceum (strain F 1598) TaxID=765440 RepID=A0A0C3FP93_PILCF|nr:hypothetical protein PILCRDRAFT_816960 [Piloderma croceum F 1598]